MSAMQKADKMAAEWAVLWGLKSVAHLAGQLVLQKAAALAVPSVLKMAANLGVQSAACLDSPTAVRWAGGTDDSLEIHLAVQKVLMMVAH